MFQRFGSIFELKKNIPLENFEILPGGSDNKCVYCGLDLFELLYQDEFNTYVRCNLCNALWIISSSFQYAD
jgi:hypothetical protein